MPETIMETYRTAIKTHAEQVAGKSFDEISHNQLRVMNGFSQGLGSQAQLAKFLDTKLRNEQNINYKQLLIDRINRWVAKGRPADQIVHIGEGSFGLKADGSG